MDDPKKMTLKWWPPSSRQRTRPKFFAVPSKKLLQKQSIPIIVELLIFFIFEIFYIFELTDFRTSWQIAPETKSLWHATKITFSLYSYLFCSMRFGRIHVTWKRKKDLQLIVMPHSIPPRRKTSSSQDYILRKTGKKFWEMSNHLNRIE